MLVGCVLFNAVILLMRYLHGHCLVEHFFPKMTYEDYVENNILQPLQMKDTGFKITDA